MSSHVKAILALSAVFLIGCGGQQARELSGKWYHASEASVAYAQAMKEADLLQSQALSQSLSEQSHGADIVTAYRNQVTTRGQLVLHRVDADYFAALADGRAAVNKSLETVEEEIATHLDHFAEGVIELQKKAEALEDVVQAGDIVSRATAAEAAAEYYRYLSDYQEMRAEYLAQSIVLIGDVLPDYEAGLAHTRETHKAAINALVEEYLNKLDQAAGTADTIEVPTLQPSYASLITFLNQNTAAAHSMNNYHQFTGFGKGSLFQQSLDSFGQGAVAGLFGDVKQLPTFSDLKTAGESLAKGVLVDAEKELDTAKNTAAAAFAGSKEAFAATLTDKIVSIVNRQLD